jgi:nucleoside-diphosphate-sugar epimerase
MLEGAASKTDGKPGYYIHLSGTGILADFADDDAKEHRGRLNPHVYNDLDGVEEVLNRPDGRLHRHTDKAIQEAGKKYDGKVKTAIVCPPDMYGKGTGPKKVESVFVPAFIPECKKVGAAWYYGSGENRRGWAHVEDVARLFTGLAEQAAKDGGSATWGREGYYFATVQESTQKELATAFGKTLHARGILKTAEPKQVDEDVVDDALSDRGYPGLGWYNFGNNSRAKSGRAQKVLGWKPQEKSLWDVLESDIDLTLASENVGKL